uniref:WLM domain-containing protein n=1 Tax=viral metagenome TaxID=1070528 RepID=A0A6C0KDI2_9ZZZZ
MSSVLLGIVLFILVVLKIMYEIRDNYENQVEDDDVLDLVEQVRHVDPKVDGIVDHLKFFEGRKSYTINKTYVHICKKDKYGKLYAKNQLVLVLLHEIAHALCDEVGHTDKFNKILDDLLDKAAKKKIYDPSIPNIPDYCEY